MPPSRSRPMPAIRRSTSASAVDTDGADGGAGSTSDPAGAMIDQVTFTKMKSLKLDPKAYLDNNDATAFFAATGDLLQTGPTLTNVNDVRVILGELRRGRHSGPMRTIEP